LTSVRGERHEIDVRLITAAHPLGPLQLSMTGSVAAAPGVTPRATNP
jgi:hypothetical protein